MDNINSDKKICSFCGEEVSIDYKRCPYCGSLAQLENGNKYENIEDTRNIQPRNEGEYIIKSSIDENGIERIHNSNVLIEGTKEDDSVFKEQNAEKLQNNEIIKKDSTKKIVSHKNSMSKEQTHKGSLSNIKKVFLTAICTLIPGIGQLAGVIVAIIYMNIEDDSDRNTFGFALLISSLTTFIIVGIGFYFFAVAIGNIIK
ncbi:UNVERIFIED_CONTAM: hypothetical protein Cloal_3979 [Acetivibrio alkalicellulosi]